MMIGERVHAFNASYSQRRHAPPPPRTPSPALTRQSRETATDPRSEADRTPQSAPQPATREITRNNPPLRPKRPATFPPAEGGGARGPSYVENLHIGTSTQVEGIGGGFLENYPTARYGRCQDWKVKDGRRGVRRRGKALGNDNRAPESA